MALLPYVLEVRMNISSTASTRTPEAPAVPATPVLDEASVTI